MIKSAINTMLIMILEFTQNLQLKYNNTDSKSKLCECQNIFLPYIECILYFYLVYHILIWYMNWDYKSPDFLNIYWSKIDQK